MAKVNEPKLLTVKEVAAMLNVKEGTIYEWSEMHYIPFIDLATGKKKRCLRFDQGDVVAWLEERKSKGRAIRVP